MTPAKALKKVKGSAFHCSLPPGEMCRYMKLNLRFCVFFSPKILMTFLYSCRVIGEQNGLPSLLVLLFKSLLSRKDSAWLGNVQNSDSFISDIKREWEYGFAVEICEQYTSSTWLSSLVMLLQTISKDSSSKECLFQMRLVLEFMFEKLQDPEFAFAVSLEPRNNVSVGIQVNPLPNFCF